MPPIERLRTLPPASGGLFVLFFVLVRLLVSAVVFCAISLRQAAAAHGGFGTGGLAFQLGYTDGLGDEEDGDDYDDVDHDLITVS